MIKTFGEYLLTLSKAFVIFWAFIVMPVFFMLIHFSKEDTCPRCNHYLQSLRGHKYCPNCKGYCEKLEV